VSFVSPDYVVEMREIVKSGIDTRLGRLDKRLRNAIERDPYADRYDIKLPALRDGKSTVDLAHLILNQIEGWDVAFTASDETFTFTVPKPPEE
jgi:hypothetical protein